MLLEWLTVLSTLCTFFLPFTLCSNAPEEDAGRRIRLQEPGDLANAGFNAVHGLLAGCRQGRRPEGVPAPPGGARMGQPNASTPYPTAPPLVATRRWRFVAYPLDRPQTTSERCELIITPPEVPANPHGGKGERKH